MPIGLAGGLALAGTAASVFSASKDRKSAAASTAAQSAQVADSRAYLEKAGKQARADLFDLFPQAQAAREAGSQGALDIFQQTIPMQQRQFQGGNVAAQNQLISGLPQIQNALMGNPVNTNFQPYQANIQPMPTTGVGTQQMGIPKDFDRAIMGGSMTPNGTVTRNAYGGPNNPAYDSIMESIANARQNQAYLNTPLSNLANTNNFYGGRMF